MIDPPPGSRCIPMRTVCYFVQRRRNSTHTREEARGAARETDACRARCAESRGRGTRSFTLLDPRSSTGPVVWTLESAWRRDRVREVITRQTGRSSGPAPARAAVGDLGGVARTRDASPPLRRTGPGGRSVPHASGSARATRRRRRGARRCRWLRGARQCASWTGVAHVGRRTRGETHSETPDGSRDFPRYYGVPPRDR